MAGRGVRPRLGFVLAFVKRLKYPAHYRSKYRMNAFGRRWSDSLAKPQAPTQVLHVPSQPVVSGGHPTPNARRLSVCEPATVSP
jgi:hypothetical protein